MSRKSAEQVQESRVLSMASPKSPSDIERLRLNELLVGLDDETFDKFCGECEFMPFSKGDYLIEEGIKQDKTFFILEGNVNIIHSGDDSNRIIFRDVGEGGWFGEIAAIDKGQRTASAVAVSEGKAAIAPRRCFLNLILDHRQVAVKVLEHMATLIRVTTERYTEISSFTGLQRVYLQLLELAEPDPMKNGEWIIKDMPTHEKISADAFTSKDAVARALGKICGEGHIAKRSLGKLKIMDREALMQLTGRI